MLHTCEHTHTHTIQVHAAWMLQYTAIQCPTFLIHFSFRGIWYFTHSLFSLKMIIISRVWNITGAWKSLKTISGKRKLDSHAVGDQTCVKTWTCSSMGLTRRLPLPWPAAPHLVNRPCLQPHSHLDLTFHCFHVVDIPHCPPDIFEYQPGIGVDDTIIFLLDRSLDRL